MPTKRLQEGKIVERYVISNTRIAINDAAYAGISEEEKERRLNKIDQTCWKILRAAQAEGKNI